MGIWNTGLANFICIQHLMAVPQRHNIRRDKVFFRHYGPFAMGIYRNKLRFKVRYLELNIKGAWQIWFEDGWLDTKVTPDVIGLLQHAIASIKTFVIVLIPKEQAGYYPNQWWPSRLTHICVTGSERCIETPILTYSRQLLVRLKHHYWNAVLYVLIYVVLNVLIKAMIQYLTIQKVAYCLHCLI